MDYDLTIRDYATVFRRRFAFFLVPCLSLFVIGCLTAFLLSPRYEASGLILVESQQIPTALIQSTVTGFAAERIQIINQRVMTRSNLSRIIDKFDLFDEDDAGLSLSDKVERVRSDISIDLVSAQTNERRNSETTIAFTLAYNARTPKQALSVTNELVTLFLDENVRTRTARASETTDFLANESDKLRRDLEALEEQVAEFKQANANALPENLDLNLNLLERSETELKRIEAERKGLDEELRFLRIELTAAQSGLGNTSQNSAALSPAQQLSQARSQLIGLRARYSDQHPDVQAVLERIASLEREVQPDTPLTTIKRDIAAAQATVDALEGTYPNTDQRVRDARADLAALKRAQADLIAATPEGGQVDPGFDLETARLEGQIAATKARISVFNTASSDVRARIEDMQQRVLLTPEIERGLATLTRDYENSLEKYEDIKSKQLEAQMAENLEEGKKAERFLLIEPPVLPEKPSSPNRPLILGIALFGSLIAGVGTLALSEILLGGVSSPVVLAQIMRQPPLAVIPMIKTDAETLATRRMMYMAAATSLTVIVLGLVSTHLFYTPIDILWYKLMMRF